jgi:hypothetical protein
VGSTNSLVRMSLNWRRGLAKALKVIIWLLRASAAGIHGACKWQTPDPSLRPGFLLAAEWSGHA